MTKFNCAQEIEKMIIVKNLSDKLAISLSLTCAIHCLVTPLLLLLLPSFAALQLDTEAFHYWMVIAVLPISVYALFLGCKHHKRYRLLLIGLLGLTILVLAVVLGEALIGEFWEKALTLIGATVIASSHLWNFRLCQAHRDCHGDKCATDKGL
ncbi:MAG: hypothetical protein ACI9FJ_002077 [Alteromonadaceae bacterium]|jgi:hypothetical protein